MSVLDRALAHYRKQRAVALAAVRAARRQVREHPGDVNGLARTVSAYQAISAKVASQTMATEAGRAPYVQPLAFAGRTSLGVPLTDPLQVVMDNLTQRLAAEAEVLSIEMLAQIDRLVASEVTAAGRGAASVEIVAEPLWTNYVRVLRLPSCARCVILAGRIYRDNEGFLRHPLCDCEHWPVESWEQAHDEGLVFSPADAFAAGQIRGLSVADTRVIRDGADIAKVVNARSGMYTASIFGHDGLKATTAGTTKRSEWRKANPNRPIRLRPESIYAIAENPEDQIRLLKLNGFITPDADIPTDNGKAGGSGGGGRPPAPPAAPEPDDEYPSTDSGAPVPFRPTERPAFDAAARQHILDGDPDGTGGHRFGTGRGKTEFPEDWSDDRIAEAIDETLSTPDRILERGDQFHFEKLVDGTWVHVSVRTDHDGPQDPPYIWTAYPLP